MLEMAQDAEDDKESSRLDREEIASGEPEVGEGGSSWRGFRCGSGVACCEDESVVEPATTAGSCMMVHRVRDAAVPLSLPRLCGIYRTRCGFSSLCSWPWSVAPLHGNSSAHVRPSFPTSVSTADSDAARTPGMIKCITVVQVSIV